MLFVFYCSLTRYSIMINDTHFLSSEAGSNSLSWSQIANFFQLTSDNPLEVNIWRNNKWTSAWRQRSQICLFVCVLLLAQLTCLSRQIKLTYLINRPALPVTFLVNWKQTACLLPNSKLETRTASLFLFWPVESQSRLTVYQVTVFGLSEGFNYFRLEVGPSLASFLLPVCFSNSTSSPSSSRKEREVETQFDPKPRLALGANRIALCVLTKLRVD